MQQLRGYFNGEDPLAVHTVPSAARNVLNDLFAKRGLTNEFDRTLKEKVRPEKLPEVQRRIRETENFLKHADRDPNEMHEFNPESTDFMMLEAAWMLQTLGKSDPELLAFLAWFMKRVPETLLTEAGEVAMPAFNASFPENVRGPFFKSVMESMQRAKCRTD